MRSVKSRRVIVSSGAEELRYGRRPRVAMSLFREHKCPVDAPGADYCSLISPFCSHVSDSSLSDAGSEDEKTRMLEEAAKAKSPHIYLALTLALNAGMPGRIAKVVCIAP
jgi:hypothetical protein